MSEETSRVTDLEHKTNEWVQSKISCLIGPQGTCSRNRQKTETRMVQACHMPILLEHLSDAVIGR